MKRFIAFQEPINSNDLKGYDVCVITAANNYQAKGYQKQLRWRKDRSVIPENTEFLVFADPQGKRIGSGGSTIYVLYKLLELFCENNHEKYQSPHELFKGKRILILHSGGDSRRLPAYSAVGKIFIPLPTSFSTDGFVTLFDLLLNNLMQLPCLSDGQVIVASGDVLLSFDSSKIVFNDSGVTGLAYPGPVEVASNHGVYVAPGNQSEGNLRKVLNFLQKPTYDELERCNGLDTANRAFIDTGVMNFSLDAIKVLMEASGIFLDEVVTEESGLCKDLINGKVQLDIYKEMPFAILGKKVEALSFLPTAFTNALQQIPFSVYLLPYCEFFHIGTSKQLLQNFHTVNYTASAYDFQNYSKSKVIDKSGLDNAFVYNSLINTASIKSSGPSFIEGCNLEGEVQLNGENILTGIPKASGNIKLGNGICVTYVPVNLENENGWASIIYGIEDDFKKLAEDNATTFLNDAFLNWMEGKGISPPDLWEDKEPHDLWNARLFPFSMDPAESMRISLSLQVEHVRYAQRLLREWRESPRMSLREILKSVDYERFLNNYSNLCRKVNLESLAPHKTKSLVSEANILTPKSNLSSEEILSWCVETDDYTTAVKNTLALIEQSEDILFQARLYKLLSNILRKADEHKRDIEPETKVRIEALPVIPKSTISTARNVGATLCGCPQGRSGTSFECGEKVGNTKAYLASLSESLEDVAFELVREAIGKGLTLEHQSQRIQIRSDEVVWVCAPARLDFAGGWSDTPPYCLEHGGSVLNASVKLNGQYPIQVIGKLHPEPIIKINSIDLGERIIISETSEMLSYQDPTNWSALPKAAFVVAGIIPVATEPCGRGRDGNRPLQDILKELGGGIDLTLFSAVPAGSGLGTSSILGSAIIACLSRMLGQEFTQEDLFNRTLYMETPKKLSCVECN